MKIRGGKYQTLNGREFLPLDKSHGKHPKPSPHPQIPVDWTSSSVIFTVCRRIDLSMRERLVPLGVREPRARLRPRSMHAYKSRQSRIPGDGLSCRRSGRGGCRVHEDAQLAKGILHRDSTCK